MRKNSLIKKCIALTLAVGLLTMTACSNNEKPVAGTENPGTTETASPATNSGEDARGGLPAAGEYTLNLATSKTPLHWSMHENTGGEDGNGVIKPHTTNGYYEHILNDTKDGYVFVPEMAGGEPIDVTKEFAGDKTYGIPAEATEGWAFKIPLNDKACWEDGTPITPDDYTYSYQQLLDPGMKNEAASNVYTGVVGFANAEKYYKQGQPVYTPIFMDGTYRDVADADMMFSFTKDVVFFGATAKSFYESGKQDSFKAEDGTDLYAKYSKEDYIKLTDEAKKDLIYIAGKFGDTGENAYKEFCFTFDGIPEAIDFDKVGVFKSGDNELTMVLSKKVTPFYLKYGLTATYLVNKEKYEANKKKTGDITKTSYATSVDSYMSYGPYKLVEYQPDKQFVMEKNENWHGYKDGKHDGQFQTTRIVVQVISEQATNLQLFLQGKMDKVSLKAEDMGSYRNSDFIVFTPNSYANRITFNSDRASLTARQAEGKNKLLLSYADFRKAVSLSLDREKFAAECYATSQPGFGLFNNMYVCDADTGERYRDSEAGQNVLKEVYGVQDLTTLTGYNKDEATKLFTKAYEEALANGDIKENDKVEIDFVVYQTNDTNLKIANFVKEAVTLASTGSKLEGKIEFKITPDEDYYAHSKTGAFDIIITSWGGSELDPFGVTEVYCNEDKINEYGFKPSVEKLTIDINGEKLTKTFKEWSDALISGEYTAADMSIKTTILAAIEKGVLERYICPVYLYSTTTHLRSRKINYGAEQYVSLVEFGGTRFTTYNADDAEWEKYCKENNFKLSY